jgi:hypothetical protein
VPKSTEWNRCTAQAESGNFCDDPAMDGAPFPLCIPHGAQILRFMQGQIAAVEAAPVDIRLAVLSHTFDRTTHQPTKVKYAPDPVVYYVQIDQHVKIGYSSNLRQRLKSYPLNRRLLATEPGDENTESVRLNEFAEHRAMGREWFYPAPRLLGHINRLRKSAGAPLIKRFTATQGVAP